MAKKIIQVMDTTYRDGFQSVFGGRVLMDDFLPTVESAMDAGIRHFEAGGGARFQSLFFYLNENAFDMMDRFREVVGPDVKLQTLARGVNYVGLDTGSKEILDLHAQLFKKHGISHIRNFDALNDVRNLEYSAQAIKNAGLHHEMTVTVMDLPPGCTGAHDVAFYKKTLRNYLDAGVSHDSVVFKDASGTASPQKVYETIAMARKMLPEGTHIRFHTHETANVGVAAYIAAVEAGADGIDLAREPVSGGTAQPDILVLSHALKGKDFVLGNHLGDELSIEKVLESEMVLREHLAEYFFPPEAAEVSAMIQFSPMPGGALTANTQMMRDNKILDKFPLVIKEMREVVEKGGFGTSVTPVSQFYFQQAFNNVMFGKWKKIAPGYGRMVLGYFGKTPVEPDSEVVKLAAEKLELEPTTRPAIDLADEDETKSKAHAQKILEENNLEVNDENLFIVLSCGDKGITFLKGDAKVNIRRIDDMASAGTESTNKGNGEYTVEVNGQKYAVKISEGIDGSISVAPTESVPAPAAVAPSAPAGGTTVPANVNGNVWKILVNVGDTVAKGQKVAILEAMKMEIDIEAPCGGTVSTIDVKPDDSVEDGQPIMVIS